MSLQEEYQTLLAQGRLRPRGLGDSPPSEGQDAGVIGLQTLREQGAVGGLKMPVAPDLSSRFEELISLGLVDRQTGVIQRIPVTPAKKLGGLQAEIQKRPTGRPSPEEGVEAERRALDTTAGQANPPRGPFEEKTKEEAFQSWYRRWAQELGLSTDPDDPQHMYDYRRAFDAGAKPDAGGHWPSQFKAPEHPARYRPMTPDEMSYRLPSASSSRGVLEVAVQAGIPHERASRFNWRQEASKDSNVLDWFDQLKAQPGSGVTEDMDIIGVMERGLAEFAGGKGAGYDFQTALEHGVRPRKQWNPDTNKEEWVWPSRSPRTGEWLKGSQDPFRQRTERTQQWEDIARSDPAIDRWWQQMQGLAPELKDMDPVWFMNEDQGMFEAGKGWGYDYAAAIKAGVRPVLEDDWIYRWPMRDKQGRTLAGQKQRESRGEMQPISEELDESLTYQEALARLQDRKDLTQDQKMLLARETAARAQGVPLTLTDQEVAGRPSDIPWMEKELGALKSDPHRRILANKVYELEKQRREMIERYGQVGEIGIRERFVEDIIKGKGRPGPILFEKVPVLRGAVVFAKNMDLRGSINRLSKNDYSKYPAHLREEAKRVDELIVEDYLLGIEMEMTRGRTLGSLIFEGIVDLVPYMVEFAATEGIANVAQDSVKKTMNRVLGKWATTKAGKAGIAALGFAARPFGRAIALPSVPAAEISERMLPNRLELTADGVKIIEPGDSAGRAFVKGLAATWVEYATEESGEAITKGIGWVVGRTVGRTPVVGPASKKLYKALQKAWIDMRPGRSARSFAEAIMRKGGYQGLIGEFSEERLNDVLYAVLGLDDVRQYGDMPINTEEGADMLDKLGRALWPGGRNALIEAGVLAAPMAGQAAIAEYQHIRSIPRIRAAIEQRREERLKVPLEERQLARAGALISAGKPERAFDVLQQVPEGVQQEALLMLTLSRPELSAKGKMSPREMEEAITGRLKELSEKSEAGKITDQERYEMDFLSSHRREYGAVAVAWNVALDRSEIEARRRRVGIGKEIEKAEKEEEISAERQKLYQAEEAARVETGTAKAKQEAAQKIVSMLDAYREKQVPAEEQEAKRREAILAERTARKEAGAARGKEIAIQRKQEKAAAARVDQDLAKIRQAVEATGGKVNVPWIAENVPDVTADNVGPALEKLVSEGVLAPKDAGGYYQVKAGLVWTDVTEAGKPMVSYLEGKTEPEAKATIRETEAGDFEVLDARQKPAVTGLADVEQAKSIGRKLFGSEVAAKPIADRVAGLSDEEVISVSTPLVVEREEGRTDFNDIERAILARAEGAAEEAPKEAAARVPTEETVLPPHVEDAIQEAERRVEKGDLQGAVIAADRALNSLIETKAAATGPRFAELNRRRDAVLEKARLAKAQPTPTVTPTGPREVAVRKPAPPALQPKEQKAYLLNEVDRLLEEAPEEAVEGAAPVVIDVPGDGTFEIINTKEALSEFQKAAKKFPTTITAKAGERRVPKERRLAPVADTRPSQTVEIDTALTPFLSTDETRPNVQQVHQSKDLRERVATDGRRLAVILDSPAPTKEVHNYPNYSKPTPGYRPGELPSPNAEPGYSPDAQATFNTEELGRKAIQAEAFVDAMIKADQSVPDIATIFILPDGSVEIGVASARAEGPEYQSAPISRGSIIGYVQPQYLKDAVEFLRRLGNKAGTIAWSTDEKGAPILGSQPFIFRGAREYVVQMPMRLDYVPTFSDLTRPSPAAEAERPAPTGFDTIRAADAVQPLIEAGREVKVEDVRRTVAEAYNTTPAGLAKMPNYSEKKLQEAYELALVRAARAIVAADPTDIDGNFQKLSQLYERQVILSARTSKSMRLQGYSTPAHYAYLVGLFAGLPTARNVLDTSAGNGMLLIARGDEATVNASDIDPVRAAHLMAQFPLAREMDADRPQFPAEKADAIVLNPPFGVTGNRSILGYNLNRREHIQAALALSEALAANGRAAIIIGGNMMPNTPLPNATRIFLNLLYHHFNVVHDFDISGKVYARQGTSFATRLIVINGRKATPEGFAPAEISTRHATTLEDVLRVLKEDIDNGTLVRPRGYEERERLSAAERTAAEARAAGAEGRLRVPVEGEAPGGPAENIPAPRGPGGPAATTGIRPERGPGPAGPAAGRGPVAGERGVVPEPTTPVGEAGGPGRRIPAEEAGVEEGTRPSQREAPGIERAPGVTEGGGAPGITGAAGGERLGGLRERGLTDDSIAELNKLLNGISDDFRKEAETGPGAAQAMAYPPPAPRIDPKTLTKTVAAFSILAKNPATAHFVDAARIMRDQVGDAIIPYLPSAYALAWKRASAEARVNMDAPAVIARLKPADVRRMLEGEAGAVGERIRAEQEKHNAAQTERDKARQELRRAEEEVERLASEGKGYRVPYEPVSTVERAGSLITENLRQNVRRTLEKIRQEKGPLHEYVASKLGVAPDRVDRMGEAFYAEQVDALAMLLYQQEQGEAAICADDTGTGKGRTASGMIFAATHAGKVPIFATAKPDLFTDIYRDLIDVAEALGLDVPAPYILNDDKPVMDPRSGGAEVLYPAKTAADRDRFKVEFTEGLKAPFMAGKKLILTTYTQIQNPKSDTKRAFLRICAQQGAMVMDECHEASGEESNRANFFRSILGIRQDPANGDSLSLNDRVDDVSYFSATFAKRPETMALYLRTILGRSAIPYADVVEIMKAGGVPLQEWFAEQLAAGGQLIRREKDFTGVNFDMLVAFHDLQPREQEAKRKELEKTADMVNEHLRRISDFSNRIGRRSSRFYQTLRKYIMEQLGGMTKEERDAFMLHTTSFGSVAHNFIAQVLLAARVESAVQETMKRLNPDEQGRPREKVVLALQYTLESAIEQMGITPGDTVSETDFMVSLGRALNTVTRIRYRDTQGNPQLLVVTPELMTQLGFPDLAQEYRDILADLARTPVPLPVSPIDRLREELEKRGLKVGEATRRKVKIVDGVAQNRTEEEKNIRGLIDGFNRGDYDVLIANESMFTGHSVHSHKAYADQRKRNMICIQPHANIDVMVQAFGRVNRWGQVVLPSLYVLTTHLPSEIRPAAILMKKMKSLQAQTTAQGASPYDLDVEDIMNKYGDEIMYDWLRNHPEIALNLGFADTKELKADELARKATGRLAILPLEIQRQVYSEIMSAYRAKIDELDAKGENDLVATHMDLDAQEIDSATMAAGDKANGLTDGVYLKRYDVRNPRRPLSVDQIRLLVKKNARAIDDLVSLIWSKAVPWARQHDAEKEIKKRMDFKGTRGALILRGIRSSLNQLSDMWEVGQGYAISYGIDKVEPNAILVNVTTDKKANNPGAPSAIMLHFAVPNGARILRLPMSHISSSRRLGWGEHAEHRRATRQLMTEWDKMRGEERTEMQIITGNLLLGSAFAHDNEMRTKIITFTTRDGTLMRGIPVPQDAQIHQPSDMMVTKDILLRILEQRTLSEYRCGPMTVELRWQNTEENRMRITMPVAKGAKEIITDKRLTDMLTDTEEGFVKGLRDYIGTAPEHNLTALIEYQADKWGNFSVNRSEIPESLLLEIDGEPSSSAYIEWKEAPTPAVDEQAPAMSDKPFKATRQGLPDPRLLSDYETNFRLEMPQLVQLWKYVLGKLPSVREKIRLKVGGASNVLGVFKVNKYGVPSAQLLARIFDDIDFAAKVFAHETGHLWDWLPDHIKSRGGILGRIASFVNYLKPFLAELPQDVEYATGITPSDRAQAKLVARKDAKLMLGESKSAKYKELVSQLYRDKIAELARSKGIFTEQEILEELNKVSHNWMPYDEATNPIYTAYRHKSNELYADAISVFLQAPTKLREWAPRFYQAFMNWFHRKPEIMAAWNKIQEDIKSGEIDKLNLETIYQSFEKGEEKKQDLLMERAKRSRWDIIRGFKRGIWDKREALIRRIAQAKREGREFDPALNPIWALERLARMAAPIKLYMMDTANLVDDPLFAAGLTKEDMGTFMFLTRVEKERKDIANPYGQGGAPAQRTMNELEKKVGAEKLEKLREFKERFFGIRQELVFPLLEASGQYPEALMSKIRDNDAYCTFFVQKFIEDRFGAEALGIIMPQVGTLEDITNPYMQTVLKDISLMYGAMLTAGKRTLIDWFRQVDPEKRDWKEADYELVLGPDQRKIRQPKPPRNQRDWALISYYQNGKHVGFYVPAEIGKLYRSDPILGGMFFQGLSYISKLPKTLMTGRNWPWVAWNVQKDLKASAKQLPGAGLLKMAWWTLRSIPDAYHYVYHRQATDVIRTLLKNQAMIVDQFSMSANDRLDFEDEMMRQFARFQVNSLREKNSFWKWPGRFWGWTEKFANFSEVLAKVAGYKYLKANTSLTEEEITHLVIKRAGSPDFKSGGEWRQIYNNIYLFSNAQVVGFQAGLEAARESPWSYAMKLFFYDIVPKLFMMAAAAGLLGEELKRWFAKIPRAWKMRFMIIPLGFSKSKEAVMFVAPHDYIGESIAIGLWTLFEDIPRGDWDKVFKTAYGEAPFARLNPVLKLIQQAVMIGTGDNPDDPWSGRKVIDDQVFAMGPWQRNPELRAQFFKYAASQLSGGWLYRYQGDGLKPLRDETFKLLRAPMIGPMLTRFLRVTKSGEYERAVGDPRLRQQREEDARKSYQMRELIDKRVEGLGKRRPTERESNAAMYKAWHEATRRNIVPDDYKLYYFSRRWDNTITYRFGEPTESFRSRLSRRQRETLDKGTQQR